MRGPAHHIGRTWHAVLTFSSALRLAALLTLSAGTVFADAMLPRATDRGRLRVRQTRDEIVVSAYEWTARHNRHEGGCLAHVSLKVGRELLGAPAGARVDRWYEKHDSSARVEVARTDRRTVTITSRGRLCDADGVASPISYTHRYCYRREYVRHEITLLAHEPVDGVTEVVPIELAGTQYRRFAASPSIEHGGGWHNWGAAQRGAVPAADGVAWEDTMPARYLSLFTGAYGGIDWFPTSDGAPWRWVHGPDNGSWRIEVVRGKPLISAAVYRRDVPISLTGSTTWSCYTSWPCTTRQFQPDPECAVVAPEYGALTAGDVARYAEQGWNMVMPVCGWEIRRWRQTPPEEYTFLQHDPDQPLSDAVAGAHKLGMLFVPYINLPAACLTDDEYERVGQDIRRTWSDNPEDEQWEVTDRGLRYGTACYCSAAFRDAVHPFIEQAWRSQSFDGLYYDFADVQHCTNSAHAGGPHIWSDGLFETLDWTRELMGPGKLLFLHVGTEVHPCYATENYADYAIFYENYGWASWMGRLHEPEEFYDYFTSANNTGISLATNVYSRRDVSTGELWTKMALWGDHSPFAGDPRFYAATDESGKDAQRWKWSRRVRRRFEPYDLADYEFVPLVNRPAEVTGGGWASAWRRKGDVLLLVANLHNQARRFTVTPLPSAMASVAGSPLDVAVEGQPTRRLRPREARPLALDVTVPPEDFLLIRISQAAE
jgi:hypothetical protein